MFNLLIVDDDRAIVDEIKNNIQWQDFGIQEVYTAYNVAGAKKILSMTIVDIIISDIEMPMETGLDLLKWVRTEKYKSEFLFLTCHEDFTFAKEAVNYGADAYLTKPFDAGVMYLNIQKIVTGLQHKKDMEKNSDYGEWLAQKHSFVKLDFWKAVLNGELMDQQILVKESERRHIDIKKNKKYRLVYSKLNNTDTDIDQYGKDVFEYILEGMQSEVLTEKIDNESVIKFYTYDVLSFVVVCEEENATILKEKCEELAVNYKQYFQATFTCCISDLYDINELREARLRLKALFDANVGRHGTIFYEKDVEITTPEQMEILDLVYVTELVEDKSLDLILRYLKSVFIDLSECKQLNVQSLYLIKQEITQVVYADLLNKGIQATKIFYDNQAIRFAERATDSAVDMIRWSKYLLEHAFSFEEEVEKALSLVDQINGYIHEHYNENITRNEIAEVFYLTPEYLGKLYKKKTGISLKNYINEHRVALAKEKLRTENMSISDIAESVGFDNFSYFSTLFKKITGQSPKDYREAK